MRKRILLPLAAFAIAVLGFIGGMFYGPSLFPHEESMTTDTWGHDFENTEAKLAFLGEYLVMPGDVFDAEYHIVYHDNGTGLVPGPSDWDIRAAIAIKPYQLSKWLEGFNEIDADEIDIAIWDDLISDEITWDSDDAVYYRRGDNLSYLVAFPDSNVILRAVSTMLYPKPDKDEMPSVLKTDILDVAGVIRGKIEQREIIEREYIAFIADEALAENIKDYNVQTSTFYVDTFGAIGRVISDLWEGIDTHGTRGLMKMPEKYRMMIELCTEYLLYENAAELIEAEPRLDEMVKLAEAKYDGDFLDILKNEFSVGMPSDEEYFGLIDKMMLALPDKPASGDVRASIFDCILSRELIAEELIKQITDDTLSANLVEYNRQTSQKYKSFYATGEGIIEAHMEEWVEAVNLPEDINKIPKMYADIIEKIAHYALYSNIQELYWRDPQVTLVLTNERGGSWGVWPHFEHDSYDYANPDETMASYFELIDAIIAELT